jgi:myo-inositol-1(or 4)-monophosphatase
MMSDYFPTMLDFVQDAGEIALKSINKGSSDIKPDGSVITEADKAISALAHARLATFLQSGEHVLIDEEDPRKGEYLSEEIFRKTPYLWAVDPIDATRAYANRMPHFGVSIGLLRELRPWLGIVYFPFLRELFTCDGENAFFIQNAFSTNEVRTRIIPIDEEITNRSVFIATDGVLTGFEWKSTDCRAMIFASAVCEFCWPAIGRGCGSLSKVNLWDMAGAWPVFRKAGLEMRSFQTGQSLERIDVDLFHTQGAATWRFKDHYILSSARNFPILRSKLAQR